MGKRSGGWIGEDDPAAAHGVALGIGGVRGWWVWRHRRRLQRGVDQVSPATWRGSLRVVLWIAGLAAITVAGPLLVAWPRFVWFAIAVGVMLAVGWWWDRLRE